jgi:hypothetical protein
MGNNASALAEERARTARALAEERARIARAEERARAEARARASAEAELDDVRASAEAQLAEERARTARAEERARAEARARASAEAQLAKEREQRFLAERTLAAAVELLRDRSGGTEWKAKAQALLWAHDSRTLPLPLQDGNQRGTTHYPTADSVFAGAGSDGGLVPSGVGCTRWLSPALEQATRNDQESMWFQHNGFSRACKVPRVHRPLTCAEQARLVDRMLR